MGCLSSASKEDTSNQINTDKNKNPKREEELIENTNNFPEIKSQSTEVKENVEEIKKDEIINEVSLIYL